MSSVHPLQGGDPEMLGGYRLVGRLGKGGQGVVYRGEAAGGTPVAVKTLNNEGMNDPGQQQRFVREAEAARQVAPFCTAAVLAADFEATPAYIVSEFVDGPSLREAVRRDGPLTGGDLNRVAVATATALMAIHEAGIVHRDFKPANVMLGKGGARVIDFGVAQVSQGTAGTLTNSSIGTPAYMAPEQVSGNPVSPASDIFAWGAVMVFAATGRQPFPGDTVPAILHQVLNGDPDLSGMPEPLRLLVVSAMQKDPAQRPGSTDVLMTLIGRKERPVGHEESTQVMSEAAAVSEPRQATLPTAMLGGSTTSAGAGPDGTGRGRKRGGVWVLIGAGVAAALAGGILIGQILGGPETNTGDDPNGDAGAAPSQSPPGGASNSAQPQDIPEFAAEYDGNWEGLTEDGDLYTMQVEEGERTAELFEDANRDCSYTLSLAETTDDGYAGNFEDQVGFCSGTLSGDAQLSLVDGFLHIELTDGDDDLALRVRLQPADG